MGKSSKDDETQSYEGASSEDSTARRKKSPSPRNCRTFIRREVAQAMPAVAIAFVGEAMKGSVPHFNALTKFGGFDQRPVPAEAPKRRGKSLARRMLDEVEKYEARQAAELVAAQKTILLIDNGGPQERS